MKILMPRKLVCQPLNNRVTSHKVLLSNGRVDPSLCSSTGHLGRLRQMAAISQSINQAINITFLSARLSPISASVSWLTPFYTRKSLTNVIKNLAFFFQRLSVERASSNCHDWWSAELYWEVYAGMRRMPTCQLLKWCGPIPTSRTWKQGHMLIFTFVGGRTYTHLYLFNYLF